VFTLNFFDRPRIPEMSLRNLFALACHFNLTTTTSGQKKEEEQMNYWTYQIKKAPT
jgi:hypothetical protein